MLSLHEKPQDACTPHEKTTLLRRIEAISDRADFLKVVGHGKEE